MKLRKNISENLPVYIFRNVWWFLVMTAVFLILLVSGSLFFHSQAGIQKLREKYGNGIVVSVNQDLDYLTDPTWYQLEDQAYLYLGPEIDDAFVERICTVPGIADVNLELVASAYLRDVRLQPGEWAQIIKEWTTPELQDVIKQAQLIPEIYAHVADIYGYRDSEKVSYFKNGAFELVRGRHIREDDVRKVLISDKVAEENHLTIGDEIYLEVNEYMLEGGNSTDPYQIYASQELEIVGIFQVKSAQYILSWTNENEIADNYIFADENSVRELREKAYQDMQTDTGLPYSQLICYVDKADDIYQVMNAIRNLDGIEWKYFIVEPDDESYQISAAPLEQSRRISGICFFATVIFCAFALFILLSKYKNDWKNRMWLLLLMSFLLATGCAARISPKVGSVWYSQEITEKKAQIEMEKKEWESKLAEASDLFSTEKNEAISAGGIEIPFHEISDRRFAMPWWIVILTAGGTCLIILIELALQRSEEIHKENQSLAMRDEMSKQYYQELSKVLDKNRQMVHDSRNHLLILRTYEKEGQYDKFRQYIQKLKEDADENQDS